MIFSIIHPRAYKLFSGVVFFESYQKKTDTVEFEHAEEM